MRYPAEFDAQDIQEFELEMNRWLDEQEPINIELRELQEQS